MRGAGAELDVEPGAEQRRAGAGRSGGGARRRALQGRRMCALWGGAWATSPALFGLHPPGGRWDWEAGLLLVVPTPSPFLRQGSLPSIADGGGDGVSAGSVQPAKRDLSGPSPPLQRGRHDM